MKYFYYLCTMTTEELNRLINFNLEGILNRKRLTRTDLAGKIGISRNAMHSRLKGNITTSTICDICTALEIEPHVLFSKTTIKLR